MKCQLDNPINLYLIYIPYKKTRQNRGKPLKSHNWNPKSKETPKQAMAIIQVTSKKTEMTHLSHKTKEEEDGLE